jgi:hypothetical protein
MYRLAHDADFEGDADADFEGDADADFAGAGDADFAGAGDAEQVMPTLLFLLVLLVV